MCVFFIQKNKISLLSRISLTLACPMDLRLYPLDKQVCVLQIASCKYHFSLYLCLNHTRVWVVGIG